LLINLFGVTVVDQPLIFVDNLVTHFIVDAKNLGIGLDHIDVTVIEPQFEKTLV
jgi:hypothetical protein